mgnify:FL=1
MERKNLKSVSDNLNKYSYVAKEDDYIVVTEWANGEGWDIDLNGKLIQLHDTELAAINYLTQVLMYEK